MKRSHMILLLGATLLSAATLRADATLHYKNTVKFGAGAPPQMTDAMAGVMKTAMPDSTTVQVKGKKAYTTAAHFNSVVDFEKQEITVIDTAHGQYATVYMKDYEDQILSALPGQNPPTSPEAQKFLESMHTTFSSQKTGKTDTILGIQAEETELTLTLDMPMPAAMASPADASHPAQTVTFMQMVFDSWTALPSEIQRVPALQEYSSIFGDSQANELLNPNAVFGKAFASLPGMGKGFNDMLEELRQKKSVVLRMNIQMYMPFIAQALQAAAANGNAQAPTVDPKAPLLQMSVEADQVSGAPIADSVFEVPRDYKVVSVPDFLKALFPPAAASQAAADATTAPAAANTAPPASTNP